MNDRECFNGLMSRVCDASINTTSRQLL